MSDQGHLTQLIRRMRAAARKVAPIDTADKSPFDTLFPLGLALYEAADTFLVMHSAGTPLHAALFSGNEDSGPNIHTRLKAVRDLCSAALYPLQVKANAFQQSEADSGVPGLFRFGVEHWSRLIRVVNPLAEPSDVTELSRLLDDVHDSLPWLHRAT